MAYIGETDFLIDVQRGKHPGLSIIHKYGRNPSVGSASFEGITGLGSSIAFLTAASTVRIKSGGSANDDDSSVATHAREITIQGLGSDGTQASATIQTAGASESLATGTAFWRVFRAWVSDVGVYGNINDGNIVIEDAEDSAPQDLIQISAGEGQSQYACYTIPSDKTGYLLSCFITVDGTQAASVRMMTRDNFDTVLPGPIDSVRLKMFWDGVSEAISFTPRAPLVLQPKTDIWFEAKSGAGTTQVSVEFEIILVDSALDA